MNEPGWVVESPAILNDGTRAGTFRVYVPTQARAEEICAEGAAVGVSRTFRSIELADIPPDARANIERQRSEKV